MEIYTYENCCKHCVSILIAWNMNKKNYLVGVCLLFLFSCGSLTDKLKKENASVNVSLPNKIQNKIQEKDTLPQFIEYTDSAGRKQIIANSTKDEKTGEDITTVELSGITVVAKSRNIPERNGKISLDFIVTVPQKLISNKWQLKLTPVLFKAEDRIELERLLLSGADFLKIQKSGYEKYQEFVNSIIPDSIILQKMIDQKGYKKALADFEEEIYKAWKKDESSELKFKKWQNRTNSRYEYFNERVKKNQRKVKGEGIKSILPQNWLYRDLDSIAIISKYQQVVKPKKARRQITSEDSLRLLKRYYNYKLLAENEKKKSMIEDKFREYVKFPYEKARLDTVIQEAGNFKYYYTQDVLADENTSKMKLTIEGMVLAKDESTYNIPPSDTLTYFVSSMINFIDRTPRFVFKVIQRHAEANLTSLISYKSGKTKIDEKLDNNESELRKITETIKSLTYTGEFLIDSINMTASASPEGPADMNYRLSELRAKDLKNYLAKAMDDREGVDTLLNARWIGEDWTSLSILISNSELQNKSEIINIISSTSNLDKRESLIHSKYPQEYDIIRNELYPKLRAVNFQFNLHRRGMIKDTIHTTVPDTVYYAAIELLEKRQYKDALTTLSEYNDFNTAICLMSLGYDDKALKIFERQKDTADRNYLLAILYSRMKRENDAVKAYLKSCEQDSSKRWRGNLDPEINKLIKAYNLNNDDF